MIVVLCAVRLTLSRWTCPFFALLAGLHLHAATMEYKSEIAEALSFNLSSVAVTILVHFLSPQRLLRGAHMDSLRDGPGGVLLPQKKRRRKSG